MKDMDDASTRARGLGPKQVGSTPLATTRIRSRGTPQRLASAVHVAIERRAGAERVSRAFENAGGARAAVDAIESMTPGG